MRWVVCSVTVVAERNLTLLTPIACLLHPLAKVNHSYHHLLSFPPPIATNHSPKNHSHHYLQVPYVYPTLKWHQQRFDHGLRFQTYIYDHSRHCLDKLIYHNHDHNHDHSLRYLHPSSLPKSQGLQTAHPSYQIRCKRRSEYYFDLLACRTDVRRQGVRLYVDLPSSEVILA